MTDEVAKFRFVCATRASQEEFFHASALGRSLQLCRGSRLAHVEIRLFELNSRGLSHLYNQAIREAAADPAILIFVHDDVYLCDWFWPVQIQAGLRIFDVVGVAGSSRRLPQQPAWCFLDESLKLDSAEFLSGVLAHGKGFPPAMIMDYGPCGRQVKLLDGVLIAAHSRTLLGADVQFDEQFAFHFYDMDFCRTLESKHMRMGTIALSAIHESQGEFGTPVWREAYSRYLRKWKC
jgi:hypothetical protein